MIAQCEACGRRPVTHLGINPARPRDPADGHWRWVCADEACDAAIYWIALRDWQRDPARWIAHLLDNLWITTQLVPVEGDHRNVGLR